MDDIARNEYLKVLEKYGFSENDFKYECKDDSKYTPQDPSGLKFQTKAKETICIECLKSKIKKSYFAENEITPNAKDFRDKWIQEFDNDINSGHFKCK